jgi:hypothetical protein
MVRASARAAEGAGRIADTYERLGLNVKALHAMAPDQQLAMIAGGISGLTTHQEKLNAATQIFGKGASSMLGLLEQYPSRLAEATEAAKAMGLVVKDEIAAQIESAVDSMERFKKAVGGFGTAVVTQNADKIGAVAEVLEGFALTQHWKKGASPFDAFQFDKNSMFGLTTDFSRLLNNNVKSGPAFVETDPIRAAQSAGGAAAAAQVRAQMKAAGTLPKPPDAKAQWDKITGAISNKFGPQIHMGKLRAGVEANRVMDFLNPGKLLVRGMMGLMNMGNAGGTPKPAAEFAGYRGFAAHDPLSREGYSQRVRSLAQSTGNQIQRQQLGTQKKMEKHLENLERIAAKQPQFHVGIF